MSGYTPVFDSVFHGTLCGKWPTLAVWLTILPMADKHGHIDLTYQAISALTGWPIDLLKQAFDELTRPDTESRSPAESGRRLVLIDPENRSWGWRVVNHTKYREKARKQSSDSARVASGSEAERKRASRDVPRCPDDSGDIPPSDSDSDSDSENKQNNITSDVEKVFNHWKQVHNHPRSQLDEKRRKVAKNALKLFSLEDLCAAISGYKRSSWHMGSNPEKKVYDDFGLMLRDAKQIEQGLAAKGGLNGTRSPFHGAE